MRPGPQCADGGVAGEETRARVSAPTAAPAFCRPSAFRRVSTALTACFLCCSCLCLSMRGYSAEESIWQFVVFMGNRQMDSCLLVSSDFRSLTELLRSQKSQRDQRPGTDQHLCSNSETGCRCSGCSCSWNNTAFPGSSAEQAAGFCGTKETINPVQCTYISSLQSCV